MSKTYSFVSWDLANKYLRDLLPHATSFVLEEIEANARRVGIVFPRQQVVNWQSKNDRELLNMLLEQIGLDEEVILVPDACFAKRLNPFSVLGRNLTSFAESFWKKFGECLFNGDLVALIPTRNCIAIFQHDGFYGLMSFRD